MMINNVHVRKLVACRDVTVEKKIENSRIGNAGFLP
jgi:hypothetical protein